MNTHDIDNKLPPLPAYEAGFMSLEVKNAMLKYARAAVEADRKRRGEPVAWVTEDTTADLQMIDGRPRRMWWENKRGVGKPIYEAPQPAEPVKVNAIFETQDGEVIGTTDAKVERVEWQDDGSLTVVIDYWPQPDEPSRGEPVYQVNMKGNGWEDCSVDRYESAGRAMEQDVQKGWKRWDRRVLWTAPQPDLLRLELC